MHKKYIILLPILLLTFTGFFANAQVRNTDVILSISPQFPSANEDVSASLNSYVTDLNKANITWSLNNQEESSGIGKKSFSFKTGKVGSSMNLSATINTIDGQSVSKTMTIIVAGVDLLWEAYDSYTPPFYKGKALAPSQGKFKIVAIPNIINQNGKVDANNLSYVWSKDEKTQTDSSGWGKSFLIFQNSYLDKINTVEVKVSDISGGTNTEGKIILNTTKPKILFYKNDPIFGTKWEEALNDGLTINPSGETLTVEPYFFSPKNIDSSNLTFDWSINGEKTQTPSPKNILSIIPEAGKSGSATIKVLINNTKTLFQEAEKQIQVSF